MTSQIVLHPDLSFELMNVALTALGWVREPDTEVAPPLLPGEPLVAAWHHRENGASLSYTFNPVVLLRTLHLDGTDTAMRHLCEEIERRVPALDESTLHELLQSDDEAHLLLGLLAARTMKAVGALNRLKELSRSAQERVAAVARSAHDEILLHLVETGAERLREEKQRHPDRSVLFPRLGDAHLRRQTLRWLIRDRSETNQHIDEVLRSALVDNDWEVRASAMLAALRLGADAVAPDVQRMTLPKTSREGPDETDRSILHSAHKLVLAHLSGESIEAEIAVGEERAASCRHLWRCMLGQPVERYDRIFLFINALCEPFEVDGDDPPALVCLEEHDGGYRLRQTGIEMCWVAPLPCWLGTDDPDLGVRNPIRRVVSESGFLIARRPLSMAQAQRLMDSNARPAADEVYSCTQKEAAQLCELLGRVEGAHIGLPEADEWEMAARGTDGRRYPWGNGVEADSKKLLSPWGLEQTVGYAPQWTMTKKEGGAGIVSGGEHDFRCSFRQEVSLNDSASLFAVRPVVRSGSA